MALRIFVKRGALRRFDRLKRDTRDLPVSIEWDRRQADRGTVPDRDRRSRDIPTGADRRGDPPSTWQAGEFVVVDDPEPEPEKP